MRLFTLIVLLAVATFTAYAADSEKKVVTPDTIAVSFANAYGKGDVKTLRSLSVLPFYLDGDILTTEERVFLDLALADFVGDTTEMEPINEYTAKRRDDVTGLDDKVFPEHVAFELSLLLEEDDLDGFGIGILIYVSTGEEPRVIGTSLLEEE